MAGPEENAILQDVEKNGDVLLLADGRRLAVIGHDGVAASIWMYGARLTLRAIATRGRRKAPSLEVTNEETGETVTATLVEERKPRRR
jgi:hypothetical protein